MPRIRSKLPTTTPAPAVEATPPVEVEYETPKQAAVRSIPVATAPAGAVNTDPRPALQVEFEGMTIQELRDMAKSIGVQFSSHHKKHDLIKLLLQAPAPAG
ncbi:MAG: hypothetical protein RLZZ297_275, partial [Chloroflexota bacterium]